MKLNKESYILCYVCTYSSANLLKKIVFSAQKVCEMCVKSLL